jgi:hypothetical protein
MTDHLSLHGRSHSPEAASFPPRHQELAAGPSRLTAELANALCRLLGERRSIDRVDLKDGFLFVYTTDPAMRQFIAVGCGEWLEDSVLARFAEIAEFNPQFFDVFYLGRTDLTAEQVVFRSHQWNEQKRTQRSTNTMQAMRVHFRRLENAWHSYPVLLRDNSDFSTYLRRTAAFELRERLVDFDIDQETYTKLVWSVLRFTLPTCMYHGRTFFAHRETKPDTPYLLFDVSSNSRLRQAMDEMGLESRSLRFDLTLRNELDQDVVKTFGRSLMRHPPPHPGFILSRRHPCWDFDAYARDLRMGHKHGVIVMGLSDRDLLQMLENSDKRRFSQNEQLLIDRMRAAYWTAIQPYEYLVECESFAECGQYVATTLYFKGLTAEQCRELADSGGVALTPEQVRLNWHVLSLKQRRAAHQGLEVYLEYELGTVCPRHGSDSNDHGD